MEFLGIGPLELVFIILIALIILGPKDMIKAGRSIGRFLRKTILSPSWIAIQRKMRNLPVELMREAGLEEADLKMKPEDLGISKDDLGIKPEDLSINIDPKPGSAPLPQNSPAVSPVPAATVLPPRQEPQVVEIKSAIPVEEFASFPEPIENKITEIDKEDNTQQGMEQTGVPVDEQDSTPTIVERDTTGIQRDWIVSGLSKPAEIPGEVHSSENPNGFSGSHPSDTPETEKTAQPEIDQTTEP